MVKIKKKIWDRESFGPAIYAPGVISANRAIWASLGAGISMTLVSALTLLSGHPTLFVPPLAASAFIVFAVPRVRLARPKNVIGGHIIASIAGNIVVALFLALDIQLGVSGITSWARVFAIGLASFLGALFMILADMDHPPALATGVVAAATFTQPNWFAAATFGAGAAVISIWSIIWNRVFFDFPPR